MKNRLTSFGMFRLILSLTLLLAWSIQAQVVVQFDLPYFNANPSTNRTIRLQAQSPFQGNVYFLNNIGTASGTIFWTNPPTGLINGLILAPPGLIPFQIYIPQGSGGTIDASNILASGTASTYPAGQVAWAIATSDNRYQLSGSVLSNTFYPLYSNPSNYTSATTVSNIVNANQNLPVITNIANGVYSNNPAGYQTAAQLQAATNPLAFFTFVTNLNTVTSNGIVAQITAGSVNATTATNISFGVSSNMVNGATNATFGAVLTSIASSNTANLVIATNLIVGATNGLATITQLASTNYDNLTITTNLVNAATNPLAFYSFVTNLNTVTSNGIVAQISGTSILSSSNMANFVYGTNGLGYVSNFQKSVAFDLGNTQTNIYGGKLAVLGSSAETYGAIASGANSFASGGGTTASGSDSLVFGFNSTASGDYSIAAGYNTTASGEYSDAFGYQNTVSGTGAFSSGFNNTASGSFSEAIGSYSLATNNYSFVWSDGVNFYGSVTNNTFNVYAANGINLNGGQINGNGAGLTNIPSSAIVGGLSPSLYVASTNGSVNGLTILNQLNIGGKTNIIGSTNIVAITGAGDSSANGTYISVVANTWSNMFNTNWVEIISAGNYYLQSNSVTHYSSANGTVWALVSPGVNPVPTGEFGYKEGFTGVSVNGYFYSTNISSQIAAAVSAATNSLYSVIASNFSSSVNGVVTNLTVWGTGPSTPLSVENGPILIDQTGSNVITLPDYWTFRSSVGTATYKSAYNWPLGTLIIGGGNGGLGGSPSRYPFIMSDTGGDVMDNHLWFNYGNFMQGVTIGGTNSSGTDALFVMGNINATSLTIGGVPFTGVGAILTNNGTGFNTHIVGGSLTGITNFSATNVNLTAVNWNASGVFTNNAVTTSTTTNNFQGPVNFTSNVNFTGLVSGVVTNSQTTVVNGFYIITNQSPNTNILYLVGAGTNTANQSYYWFQASGFYTNSVNSMQVATFGGTTEYVTNVGTSGFFYKIASTSGTGLGWSNLLNGKISTLLMNNSGGGLGVSPAPTASFATNYTMTFVTNYSSITRLSTPDQILTGNFVKVSQSGNDLLGLRGSLLFPFATINTAVTNMIPGDVMYCDAGSYVAHDAYFPIDSGFVGAGSGLTFVYLNTNYVHSYAFDFTNGGFIQGVTIITTNQVSAGDLQTELNTGGNFVANDFVGEGNGDGIYMLLPYGTFTAYNSAWYSSFDLIALSQSNQVVNAYNCTFKSVAGYNGSQYTSSRICGFSVQGTGGTFNMWGGSITASNSSSENAIYDSGNSGTAQSMAYFNNVTMLCGSVNGGTVEPFRNGSGQFGGQPLGNNVFTVGCSLNGQPLNPFRFVTPTPALAYTNGPSSGTWNVWIAFTDAAAGTPAASISLQGISTNILSPIIDLTATTGTVTNFYSFPVQPYTTNSITDVSGGSGASISVINSLFIK